MLTAETETYCQRHFLRWLFPWLYFMHSILESGLQAAKLCPLGYLLSELCLSLILFAHSSPLCSGIISWGLCASVRDSVRFGPGEQAEGRFAGFPGP